MLQGLLSVGIEAEQIDRIVITHADRDHIGGILDEQGAFVYPNAGYVLWQGAWDFWQDEDNVHEWPQEIVASIRGTLSRLEPRVELVGADEEFLPGLQIMPAAGHCHDHVVLKDAMLNRFYAICNCCSCCCGAMQAQRNGTPMIASSGYVARVDEGLCAGCGKCVEVCQFSAISVVDGFARIDNSACMGCGVCVAHCPQEAILLLRAPAKGEPLEIQRLIAHAAQLM